VDPARAEPATLLAANRRSYMSLYYDISEPAICKTVRQIPSFLLLRL
jgi:hypothetical protein